MPPPSLLRSIPPSALITRRLGPAAPSLTFRSVLIGGTGRNSTAMYYNHLNDSEDPPAPLQQKSATWSHIPSAPENPYSLSRCRTFPLSPFGGSRQSESPIGRRNNLVSQPATADQASAKPTVNPTSSSRYPTSLAQTGSASPSMINSPRQASSNYVKGTGLPSRDTPEKPWGYITFESFGAGLRPPRSRTPSQASVPLSLEPALYTAPKSEIASIMPTTRPGRRRPLPTSRTLPRTQRGSCRSTLR